MAAVEKFLSFGYEVLVEAGALAAGHFRRCTPVANKDQGGGFDPVTEADKAVEAHIRHRIEARYPSHGIVGEEYGATAGASAWSWIVDPIDGTRAFMIGLPVWGCLLGLLRDGEPVAGFMHQPIVGETFWGDGECAWVVRDGERRAIRVRAEAVLSEAVLVATHPLMFGDEDRRRFEGLAARVRMMRYGGDCYNYCLLAHGLLDIVVEDQLQSYDILPLVPIVRGAGGCITDISGASPTGTSMVVAAANETLHRSAMAAMQGAKVELA